MVWDERKGKAFLVPFVGFMCVVEEGVEVEEEESGITCRNVCVCVCHEAQKFGKQQRKQVQ